MSPDFATCSMGATRIVSDDSSRGNDALGPARALASALRRVDPDLVLRATDSRDGGTITMPE